VSPENHFFSLNKPEPLILNPVVYSNGFEPMSSLLIYLYTIEHRSKKLYFFLARKLN